MTARNTHRARDIPEVGRTGARFGPRGQWRLADDGEPDPPDAPAADSPVGMTGARFGGAARKKRKPDKAAPPLRGAEPPATELPATESPAAEQERGDEPTEQWWSADGTADFSELDTPAEPGDDHWTEEYVDWLARPESHALVRPYAWTGGRTKANRDLAVEALVRTEHLSAQPSWELRAIVELCLTPRSVAEVAALMSVPLGVARVLIADLADSGAIEVHRVVGQAPDLAMMTRVLTGLRRL
ncbi:DUF742 domain-containing protein [Actinokineospora sp. 24-640]